MTFEEYTKAKERLMSTYAFEMRKLKTEYALSNNAVSEGDIISDFMRTILVDQVQVTFRYGIFNEPSCVYSGVLLTKKGVPYKSGARGTIYQHNLVKEEQRELLHQT